MGSGTERELDLGVWRGYTVLTNARVFFVGYNTTNEVGRIRLRLQYSLRLGRVYFLGGTPAGCQRLPLPANPGTGDFSGCRFRPTELTSRHQSTPVSRPPASPRATRRVQLPQPGQYRLQAIPVGGASDRARRIRHYSTGLCHAHDRDPRRLALNLTKSTERFQQISAPAAPTPHLATASQRPPGLVCSIAVQTVGDMRHCFCNHDTCREV